MQRLPKLISIKFIEWNTKFPRGELVTIFGDYDVIETIEKSLLHYYKIFPNKHKNVNQNIILPIQNRERICDKIYTIDPPGCKDIDDAFSISNKDDNCILKIHISDVFTVLNENNLLDIIDNYTSLYLSNTILNMLPSTISFDYCSLIEKKERLMITLEIIIKKNDTFTWRFYQSYGLITKNCCYNNYPKMIYKYFNIVSNLYNKISKSNINIENSHQFIEILMIIYNHLFVLNLLENKKKPIYRSQKDVKYNNENLFDAELSEFLNIIKSSSAEYSKTFNLHKSLNLINYTHSTSPIRRIVDLINQGIFCNNLKLFNNVNIDKINDYNVILKKYYRKINKIKLSYLLYNNNKKYINLYIYDYNDNIIEIYIPEYKINIRYKLFDDSIKNVVNIDYNHNDKILKYTLNDLYEYNIPLMKKIYIPINGKPDILFIEQSIKIDLEKFKVNL